MSNRFFPYNLSLAIRTELNEAAPIGSSGINGRRAIAGFALGLAISAALPVLHTENLAQTETQFVTQYKTSIEDAIAQINEFLIVDRTLALDVAKGFFLYRNATACDQLKCIVGSYDPFPLFKFITEKDFCFYKENEVEIRKLLDKFVVLIQCQRKEEERMAQVATN